MGEVSPTLLQDRERELQSRPKKVPNFSNWIGRNRNVGQVPKNVVKQFALLFTLDHEWDTVSHDDLVVLVLFIKLKIFSKRC